MSYCLFRKDTQVNLGIDDARYVWVSAKPAILYFNTELHSLLRTCQRKSKKEPKVLESAVNLNSPSYKSSPCPCIPWSRLHPNIQTCRRETRGTKLEMPQILPKYWIFITEHQFFPTNHTLASRSIKPLCLSQERIGRALGCCTFQAHLYLSPAQVMEAQLVLRQLPMCEKVNCHLIRYTQII